MDHVLNIAPYALLAAAVLTLLVIAVRRVRKPVQEEAQEVVQPEWPKCVCGAPATHPSPKLVRKRTGWLRAFFATAPSYKRVVPGGPFTLDQLTFCEIHAHVADSMMDRFIFERIRGVQSEANERIAIEAAAFEGEKLVEQIRSIAQPRAQAGVSVAPPAPALRLLSTGTDGR